MHPIRVILADDHSITRDGIRRLLETEEDFVIVGEAADGDQVLQLVEELPVDLVLLDINMPKRDGLQVARILQQQQPMVRVVVLTGYGSEQYPPAFLKLGVRGYLSKEASAREVIAVLRMVSAGHVCFPASGCWTDTSSAASRNPTPRERTVLRLVEQGLHNRQIAGQLATSERTIQFHLSNLFAKGGVNSRMELVHRARQLGWLS